jgi:site-specific DNA recombinase
VTTLRRSKDKAAADSATKVIRCAIYTRKSSEEGLQQEFNSLDAQRESAEAFILSQAGEGWTCLPDRYDDGGFSGGTIDRPALRRLMTDIEAGKVDAVVVYKVDRLSRSLLDFARMMRVFDEQKVSFVSVTQQFNTTHSMGRLTLNILLSFAQFEREIISERTRDKIAATRRKGKWTGGMPVLGYDVTPESKLVVNPAEAERVCEIFDLYLRHESLLPVVEELSTRAWINKRWVSRKGVALGGKPFTRTSLYHLLTNVVYTGRVRYKTETHPGEHEGIVPPEHWQKVQAVLARNGATGGAVVRNRFGAFLKGLLRCAPCGCAMTPSHTTRKKAKRYRYYVCSAASKKGWATCPSKSIPAGPIEQLVIDQIRSLGNDTRLRAEVIAHARKLAEERAAVPLRERRRVEEDLLAWSAEVAHVATRIVPGTSNGPLFARLADLQERIAGAERHLAETPPVADGFDDGAAGAAFAQFDGVWHALVPREQARVIALLVERVDYDGEKRTVAVTFRPNGITSLGQSLPTSDRITP